MPSLSDLLSGNDPDQQEKIRKQSDAFRQQMDPSGDAPEESGVQDASFLPDEGTLRKGTVMGAAPIPPEAAEADAPATGGSYIAKMRAGGVPDTEIDAAAENLRLGKPHTFMGPGQKPVLTIGPSSPAGEELAQLGKRNVQISNNDAGGYNYSQMPENGSVQDSSSSVPRKPRISGDAQAFYDRTGVDPTRKSGLQAIQELRQKQDAEQAAVRTNLRKK